VGQQRVQPQCRQHDPERRGPHADDGGHPFRDEPVREHIVDVRRALDILAPARLHDLGNRADER
jgi:hypothetical protein